MNFAKECIQNLKNQINNGFLISDWYKDGNKYIFIIPALEHSNYTIGVPDGKEVEDFFASEIFKKGLMKPVNVGIILIDLIGFSKNPDDTQLKMIVRYQCEVRKAIKEYDVSSLISIGDGTILVFEENNIKDLVNCLLEIKKKITEFNSNFNSNNIPEIDYRIGVHIGNAFRYKDINKEYNYVGTGINIAQRVSTCVPSSNEKNKSNKLNSHIYVSKEAKNELNKYPIPKSVSFFDAREREVKHKVKIHVYALHVDTLT